MKRIQLVVLALLTLTQINAQMRIALVGGAHQASVNETNNLPGWETIKNGYSSRMGPHAGFIADLPFSLKSKLYFQPGVLYYARGRKFSASYDTTLSTLQTENRNLSLNYIDIPLNLVLKFGGKTKFIIGAGPYASLFFNGKETADYSYSNGDFEAVTNDDLPVGNKPDKYDVLDFGVNALAGVEFGRIFLTANYTKGLNDFFQTSDYSSSFKHQTIGGTLGIFLGKPVSMKPIVKDRDKDGVPDQEDACPDAAGIALTNGCPDKDGDGIADKDDKCPDMAGTDGRGGCPVLDRDKDGVEDADDKCPDVAGLTRYKGCGIPDTDGDGVNDEEDRCPTIKGTTPYKGCPVPDSDGDGINDEEDKCKDIAGVAGSDGCPEIKKEVIEKVNYAAKRIQFQVNKALLLPASYKVLNEVVKILNETPDLKLGIEGHSSQEGKYDVNMKLSQERAEAVKAYLVSRGIAEDRLEAQGFGPDKPLVEEKTAKDRAINRRVELNLHY